MLNLNPRSFVYSTKLWARVIDFRVLMRAAFWESLYHFVIISGVIFHPYLKDNIHRLQTKAAQTEQKLHYKTDTRNNQSLKISEEFLFDEKISTTGTKIEPTLRSPIRLNDWRCSPHGYDAHISMENSIEGLVNTLFKKYHSFCAQQLISAVSFDCS